MAVIVAPLVMSNAWRPKEIPIQPLLGEQQITNVPFGIMITRKRIHGIVAFLIVVVAICS